MSLTEDAELIIGVGTHMDTHTAAICDARGRAVSQLQVPATTAGYVQLLTWVRAAAGDRQVIWAVEGTRHYGLGLARTWPATASRYRRPAAAVTSASAGLAKATRSTPSARTANPSPGPGLRRCAPTGTGRRCGY